MNINEDIKGRRENIEKISGCTKSQLPISKLLLVPT